MAKKKAEELQEDLIVENEAVEVEEAPEVTESVEAEIAETEEVEEIQAASIAPIVEVIYNPKDIVEFYNQKGELRYAPYGYISKRGYEALKKYTKK